MTRVGVLAFKACATAWVSFALLSSGKLQLSCLKHMKTTLPAPFRTRF
jgi:hypothetical protein